MELTSLPDEAFMLIQAIQVRQKEVVVRPIYQTTITDNSYAVKKLEYESHSIPQEMVIFDTALPAMCSSAEWNLIGRISSALFHNNCLWQCPKELKNNSSARKALNSLLVKGILWPTNETNYYLVNPTFIRRGRELEILYTTGQMIYDNKGIDDTLLMDKRAIRDFDFSKEPAIPKQLGYGYVDDTTQ